MSAVITAADCVYTPCFCEENAYKLCEHLLVQSADLCVAFISNPRRQIPVWQQRASSHPSGFVLWDYHVLVLQRTASDCLVWDLDTTLPFPCSLSLYADAALQIGLPFRPEFCRFWRIISANEYLSNFASDRSHMQLKDGSWQATPPTYPCIVAADGNTMRLNDYISMTDTPQVSSSTSVAALLGTVYSETAFLEAFSPSTAQNSSQQEQQQPLCSAALAS